MRTRRKFFFVTEYEYSRLVRCPGVGHEATWIICISVLLCLDTPPTCCDVCRSTLCCTYCSTMLWIPFARLHGPKIPQLLTNENRGAGNLPTVVPYDVRVGVSARNALDRAVFVMLCRQPPSMARLAFSQVHQGKKISTNLSTSALRGCAV